jgi:hypothetical protein
MPDNASESGHELRQDLDKLIKRVNELDVAVNGTTAGLAQKIAALEQKVAEMERPK